MTTREALQKMDEIARGLGYEVTQDPVYGTYSQHEENGVKVRSVTRTYAKQNDDKMILAFDAATDAIF